MKIKDFAKKSFMDISQPSKKTLTEIIRGRQIVFLLLCVSLILAAALGIAVAAAGADPGDDIATRESEAAVVQEDIAALNAELEVKVENYNYANYELEQTEQKIVENEQLLSQTLTVLDDTQERLDKRMSRIYKTGTTDYIDVLMDTTDVSDFLSKFDMLAKVGEQDMSDVEQVKLLKSQIEEAKTQLAQDQEKQSALVVQLEAEKADIEAGLAERKRMLSEIEDEIATMREQQAAQQAELQAQAMDTISNDVHAAAENFGPAPVSTAGGAVGIAMQYLGVPYVWGGASSSGVDCSGLVMVVYGALGYSLPHSAAAQYSYGTPISYDQLAPGDLVFFGYGGGISHVGIYIGGGSMIHAPFEGEVVQIAPVNYGGSYVGACRL